MRKLRGYEIGTRYMTVKWQKQVMNSGLANSQDISSLHICPPLPSPALSNFLLCGQSCHTFKCLSASCTLRPLLDYFKLNLGYINFINKYLILYLSDIWALFFILNHNMIITLKIICSNSLILSNV